LPQTPPYIRANKKWTSFEISDVIPQVSGSAKAITVSLYPGRWEETREYGCTRQSGDACFKDLHIEVEQLLHPSIDGQNLVVM
jgi:hypothetical protein